MSWIRLLAGTLLLSLPLAAQARAWGPPEGHVFIATFKTSLGDIRCILLHENAPETVRNFVELARGSKWWMDPHSGKMVRRPLYNGTIFHRVIPGFMIQGGDPLGDGTGGPGYTFADEGGDKNKFARSGVLAMANRGPNTNGSQFFITDAPATHLDGHHRVRRLRQPRGGLAHRQRGPRRAGSAHHAGGPGAGRHQRAVEWRHGSRLRTGARRLHLDHRGRHRRAHGSRGHTRPRRGRLHRGRRRLRSR